MDIDKIHKLFADLGYNAWHFVTIEDILYFSINIDEGHDCIEEFCSWVLTDFSLNLFFSGYLLLLFKCRHVQFTGYFFSV